MTRSARVALRRPPAGRGAAPTTAPGLVLVLLPAVLLAGCTGEPYDEPAAPGPAATAPARPGAGGPQRPTPGAGRPTSTPPPVPQPGMPHAADLAGQVKDFLARATTVRVRGTLNHSGTPMALDVTGSRDGGALRGTVSVGADQGFEVLRVEGETYVRRPQADGGPPGAWSRLTPEGAGQVALLDVDAVLTSLEALVTRVVEGRVRQVVHDATRAVELDAGPSTLVVADDGTGRLLKVTTVAGPDAGSVELSGWGDPVDARRPAPAEVVDPPVR